MDAAAKNAGGVGPGAYVIITSMGSIPAGAHGVVERYADLARSCPNGRRRVSHAKDLKGSAEHMPTLTPPNEPMTCEGCACKEYSRDSYPCNSCFRNDETLSDQYRPPEGEA